MIVQLEVCVLDASLPHDSNSRQPTPSTNLSTTAVKRYKTSISVAPLPCMPLTVWSQFYVSGLEYCRLLGDHEIRTEVDLVQSFTV